MMGNLVLLGLVAVLAASYHAARLLSRSSQRQRDARALRHFISRDIRAGRRSLDDAVVAEVLDWCDEVEQTGRDVPLTVGRASPADAPTPAVRSEPSRSEPADVISLDIPLSSAAK